MGGRLQADHPAPSQDQPLPSLPPSQPCVSGSHHLGSLCSGSPFMGTNMPCGEAFLDLALKQCAQPLPPGPTALRSLLHPSLFHLSPQPHGHRCTPTRGQGRCPLSLSGEGLNNCEVT